MKNLKAQTISSSVKEIVSDLIGNVKSPEPPLPDVSIPEIAER